MMSNAGFTFIDILPECRESEGIFTAPSYESFRTLIDRANIWLKANRKWEITTCESVEFKYKGSYTDNSKMTYFEHRDRRTKYIRGLRLWLTERQDNFERHQQIGYMNLIPLQVGDTGVFGHAVFETRDQVIQRFNSMIRTKPIPGRVINIESQEMKLSHYHDLDPDCSYWKERGESYKRFLFVIRIFYESMPGDPEEIGLQDFVPNQVESGGFFSHPVYEPFSNLVNAASNWCSRSQGIRFCNAQSIEIKMKSGGDMDTQRMHYTEHGDRTTFYMRILRVAYTRTLANQYGNINQPSFLGQLTCKTFVPVLLSTGFLVPEYETLHATKQRVSAWVKATGAIVISAETAAMRIMTGGEARYGTEASYTYNRSQRDEYWIFTIRLYLHGAYREPPTETLPPLPEVNDDCCVIL